MASNQHRNLTGEQLHNPKGFDGASPSTTLIKNAAGEIEWVSNSNFDNALDYVSPQSAPPTEVQDDIYLLDDTGVVYDIDTIAWQSGNTIRYTFNGTPNLSAITAGDYLVTSGNGNAVNDGTFIISAVDDGLDYIEITNANRSDATDDEASDAVGTAYYTLGEWDGASKGSHVKFDGTNWNSTNAQDGAICYDETSNSHRIYDAANTNWDTSLSTAAGGITASGTPVDNQVAVFTSATNVEGHTGFTYDSTKSETSLIQGNSNTVVSYKDVKITAETDSASLQMSSFSAGATDYPEIRTTRTRGTVATPTAVQTGDDLLRQNIFGHTGTTSSNGANIIVEATENWTPTNKGVSYTIGTEANGGTGIVERFKIDGSGDITLGNFKFDGTQTVGAGQDNYVLTYDNATGKISLEASAGGGGGLTDIVDDTTPQLGGSLDVNGNKIVSVSNGDIDIEPNGTGNVLLGNFTFDADQTVGAGQDNYVLTYDNATGLISLEAAAGGGSSLWSENVGDGIYFDSVGDAVSVGDTATNAIAEGAKFYVKGDSTLTYAALIEGESDAVALSIDSTTLHSFIQDLHVGGTDASPDFDFVNTSGRLFVTGSSPQLRFQLSGSNRFRMLVESSHGEFELYNNVGTQVVEWSSTSASNYDNTGTNFVFGATSADASARLQIDSTTQGFLPPRMTTTQRDNISTPATGLMVYNTTTNKLNFYNGSAWEAVTSA